MIKIIKATSQITISQQGQMSHEYRIQININMRDFIKSKLEILLQIFKFCMTVDWVPKHQSHPYLAMN